MEYKIGDKVKINGSAYSNAVVNKGHAVDCIAEDGYGYGVIIDIHYFECDSNKAWLVIQCNANKVHMVSHSDCQVINNNDCQHTQENADMPMENNGEPLTSDKFELASLLTDIVREMIEPKHLENIRTRRMNELEWEVKKLKSRLDEFLNSLNQAHIKVNSVYDEAVKQYKSRDELNERLGIMERNVAQKFSQLNGTLLEIESLLKKNDENKNI